MSSRMKRWGLAALATVVVAGGFMMAPAQAESEPSVNGWVISWDDEGWYEVQTSEGRNVCEGGRSCNVVNSGAGAGIYQVINHSTKQNWFKEITGETGADENGGTKLTPPNFRSVGYQSEGGYVSVIWNVLPSETRVNVYRDDNYLTTVDSGGTVYNDFDGYPGASYYLVAVRNDEFSDMSQKMTAHLEPTATHAEVFVPEGVKLSWRSQADVRYQIRRLRSGGPVAPGQGTVVGATDYGVGSWTDLSAKGALSYGVEGFRRDGTTLPMVTITPVPIVP